jgi:hypothetical protein
MAPLPRRTTLKLVTPFAQRISTLAEIISVFVMFALKAVKIPLTAVEIPLKAVRAPLAFVEFVSTPVKVALAAVEIPIFPRFMRFSSTCLVYRSSQSTAGGPKPQAESGAENPALSFAPPLVVAGTVPWCALGGSLWSFPMSVLPKTTIEQIQFCEAHWPVWNTAPTAIGLTTTLVNSFKTATQAARASFDAAQVAREASKAATTTLHGNTAIMREQAADLIRQIKAYAELQVNPATVYAARQVAHHDDDPARSPRPAGRRTST